MPSKATDLLITATETNSHHGVGILLQRFFPDSTDFTCVRSTSLYNGEEPFGTGHHELCSRFLTLAETEAHLREICGLYQIRRILCVPYYREDFVHGVLAKRITGAPLCTFIMDDQNIFASQVPDQCVDDLLKASDLRLGISAELCAAYSRKFSTTLHLLPPVVAPNCLPVPCYWQEEVTEPVRAAMIGNVWTAARFKQLRRLLSESKLGVDWYGNGSKASWLEGTPEEWEHDNILCMGFLPEEDLVASLASYPFLILPSGSLDEQDDNQAFSRLSLPSRLLFVHASTDVPVLVLGSPQSAAGRLVTRLGTGICSAYNTEALGKAISRLLNSEFRKQCSGNVQRWRAAFIMTEAGAWLWRSLAEVQPQPALFQRAFPNDSDGLDWLDQIPAPRLRSQPIVPQSGEAFHDAHAPSFGFLRTTHWSVLVGAGLPLPPLEQLELSIFASTAARYVIEGALPSGGDVLILDPNPPAALRALPTNFRLWQIDDLDRWQRAGYAGDPAHVVSLMDRSSLPQSFPQFSAIVSTYWCGQLSEDPHALEGLSLYLDACTVSGGLNVHCFSAVLHSGFFWTGPAHSYLVRRFLSGQHWPGLNEILSADDLYVMNEGTYEKYWRASVAKPYREFGKPIALSVIWRKSGPLTPC